LGITLVAITLVVSRLPMCFGWFFDMDPTRLAHILSPYSPEEQPPPTPEPDARFGQIIQSAQQCLKQPVQGVENMESIHQALNEWPETIVYVYAAHFFVMFAYDGQWYT